jgi:hypothetical protein
MIADKFANVKDTRLSLNKCGELKPSQPLFY